MKAAAPEEALEDIVLDDIGFEDDTPIEMVMDEAVADDIAFDEIAFTDDEEYVDDVEDGMELEEAEMLEEPEMLEEAEMLEADDALEDIDMLDDPDALDEVEMLDEVLEEVEPAEPVEPAETIPAMEITLDEDALDLLEDEPVAGKNVSIGKTKTEVTKDQISEIQRQAEINQQRIAEVLSQTVKVAPAATPPAPPPPDVQNRRQHNRIQASILVDYISTDDEGDSSQGMGVVLDISISGLQLQTPRELVGTHVKVYATDFNDNIMEILGIVRQSRQKDNVYLNGIAFESTENDTIKFITNLVRIFNARKYTKPGE